MNMSISKATVKTLVCDINKRYGEHLVSYRYEDGNLVITALGGKRICSTLLEAITYLQGIYFGISASTL